MPRGRWPGRAALGGFGGMGLAILVLVATPLSGVGQDPRQDAGLDRVESLAASGRVGEARNALTEWWENGRADAPRTEVQRGLWLRAVLTVDRSLAELDLHRLALEFPTGPYAPMAVVRLGYGAEAAGDWETATQHFERVLRDYPDTPEAREARTWLDGREERSRRWARSDDAVTEHPSGTYAVQLGAFRDVERARTVEDQARDVGLRPRVVQVPGTDLIRVRVGRFLTSREASEAMERIRGMGLDATVAVDADRERAVAR